MSQTAGQFQLPIHLATNSELSIIRRIGERNNSIPVMAPNKKKKKAMNNPARGFATISTASKTKSNEDEENSAKASPESDGLYAVALQVPPDNSSHVDGKHREKDLHELTPDELEKKLEQSTLQVLIETYGKQVQRDVSRQVSKLQTERRILRNQAESLVTTYRWLPTEIIELITTQVEAQYNIKADTENVSHLRSFTEDIDENEILINLWKLRQLLPRLGFSVEKTNLALCHLLTTAERTNIKHLTREKDMIWGLEECLCWLAFTSNGNDIPRYGPVDTQQIFARNKKASESVNSSNTGTSVIIDALEIKNKTIILAVQLLMLSLIRYRQ